MTTEFQLPELSLVVLIGPSGSGKSTFARKHFRPTEVLSSDTCRGLVSDDENVRIEKRGGRLVIEVDSDDEHVRVAVPIRMIGTVADKMARSHGPS